MATKPLCLYGPPLQRANSPLTFRHTPHRHNKHRFLILHTLVKPVSVLLRNTHQLPSIGPITRFKTHLCL